MTDEKYVASMLNLLDERNGTERRLKKRAKGINYRAYPILTAYIFMLWAVAGIIVFVAGYITYRLYQNQVDPWWVLPLPIGFLISVIIVGVSESIRVILDIEEDLNYIAQSMDLLRDELDQ